MNSNIQDSLDYIQILISRLSQKKREYGLTLYIVLAVIAGSIYAITQSLLQVDVDNILEYFMTYYFVVFLSIFLLIFLCRSFIPISNGVVFISKFEWIRIREVLLGLSFILMISGLFNIILFLVARYWFENIDIATMALVVAMLLFGLSWTTIFNSAKEKMTMKLESNNQKIFNSKSLFTTSSRSYLVPFISLCTISITVMSISFYFLYLTGVEVAVLVEATKVGLLSIAMFFGILFLSNSTGIDKQIRFLSRIEVEYIYKKENLNSEKLMRIDYNFFRTPSLSEWIDSNVSQLNKIIDNNSIYVEENKSKVLRVLDLISLEPSFSKKNLINRISWNIQKCLGILELTIDQKMVLEGMLDELKKINSRNTAPPSTG